MKKFYNKYNKQQMQGILRNSVYTRWRECLDERGSYICKA